MKIDPKDINIGDRVWNHGAAMKVEQIKVVVYTDEQFSDSYLPGVEVSDHRGTMSAANKKHPCFIMRGSFISGDRNMFDYFRSTISAGPDCGKLEELSSKQGNKLADWGRTGDSLKDALQADYESKTGAES